jgi:copper resistance protein B
MNEEASMSRRVLFVCIALAWLAFGSLAQAEEFQGMSPAVPALSESRTPIPLLTDADRAAVYNQPVGMARRR